ncbi:MAG: hypothetical protein EYC71_04705 [Gammaproteobacteria bacterium]|nr:MAG: hypothetical protein EYC71_04705 [Gammaproteobacteria bacterium]
MLKELQIIASGLLGLHGYPTPPPHAADSTSALVTAATQSAADSVHDCSSRSRQPGNAHQRARTHRNGAESKVS